MRITISGSNLKGLEQEAGGHRFQRVPPTEKRNRVHTSTITVAVIAADRNATPIEDELGEVEISWFSGTGKGGQHRNKTQNCCRVRHLATGLVESRQGRRRETNLREAKAALLERLRGRRAGEAQRRLASAKKAQVGSGMRADKSVTIRMQDNRVVHHATGKTMQADRYMKGFMDEIWAG